MTWFLVIWLTYTCYGDGLTGKVLGRLPDKARPAAALIGLCAERRHVAVHTSLVEAKRQVQQIGSRATLHRCDEQDRCAPVGATWREVVYFED